MARLVDRQAADPEVRFGTSPPTASVSSVRAAAGAAQHGFEAGQELFGLERLFDIVVGAQLETHDFVEGVAARRQDQHGNRRLEPHFAQHVETRFAGQHEIEEHGVRRFHPEKTERLFPARRRADAIAVLFQIQPQQFENIRVVVDG